MRIYRESVSYSRVFTLHLLIYISSRAEYMLDVIGAGATASADRNWHEVWLNSTERQDADEELQKIHAEGRKEVPVSAASTSAFATPWFYQARVVIARTQLSYWRDPTYLLSKFFLNIVGGLLIGFTFFKSKDTIQGSQNKLFVSSTMRFSASRGFGVLIIVHTYRQSSWPQSW